MKANRLCLFLGASVLAGCAMTGRAPALAGMENQTFEKDSYGQEFITAAMFERVGEATGDSLPQCVAQTVRNQSVSLSDSAGSFVGQYSGRYYRADNSREAGGGQVITYVSDDKKTVVAQGATDYRTRTGMLEIGHSVRFALNATVKDGKRMFRFDRLQHAQLSTGTLPNDGYQRIGAWAGATGPEAVAALERVADSINECLSTQ